MKRDIYDDEEIDALVERVTRALDVPEPSPMFWERFPERVRAAIRAEAPAPTPAPWWRRHAMALSLSGALSVALVVWAVVPLAPVPAGVSTRAGHGAPAAAATGDDAWSVVSATAESAGVDALREAGFTVRPGGADAAIEELTEAERAVFAALLAAEMKGEGPDGL